MRDGVNMVNSNTRVHSNGSVMDLHGDTIAIYDRIEGKLTLRDCGWRTNTTKERLNGIIKAFGIPSGIYQDNFEWYVKNHGKWDGSFTWTITA